MLFDFFKRKKNLSPEEFYAQKNSAVEALLCTKIDTVYHAMLGYPVGGPLHIGISKNKSGGTYFTSDEVMSFEEELPMPNSRGRYELVMVTRLENGGDEVAAKMFDDRLLYCRKVMTMIGRYAKTAILEPHQTLELPIEVNETHYYLLDVIDNEITQAKVGDEDFHLLCVILITEAEFKYCKRYGAERLLFKLKKDGHHPFSDLNR